jgi:hypothetical protein
MRQTAHDIWACELFLSRPVSLTARMKNKNRRGGHCHGMRGRAKPLSLPVWTRTLLSPAIRRPPMPAAVSQMWRTSCPVTTLIDAVYFAWPATTSPARHYASRLMETNDIDLKIRCQARFRHIDGMLGIASDTAGMTGTTRGDIRDELFCWQALQFCNSACQRSNRTT